MVWPAWLTYTLIFLTIQCVAPHSHGIPETEVKTQPPQLESVAITAPHVESERWTQRLCKWKIRRDFVLRDYKAYRNCILTLSDIQDILSKVDDEDEFMYILADKLGYRFDGKYDDPHIIPVIKSHKDKLIALLEKKRAGYSTPTPLQMANHEDAISRQKIGYEVAHAVLQLNADAIYDLLNAPLFPDTFGYAVSIVLGYSDNDEHMKYLENKDVKELRDFLKHILESKMHSKKKTPTLDGQGPEDQEQKTSGEMDSYQSGPTQGGRDKERTNNVRVKESDINQKLSTAMGVPKKTEDSLEEGIGTKLHEMDDNTRHPIPVHSSQKTNRAGQASIETDSNKNNDGGNGPGFGESNKEGNPTENGRPSLQTNGGDNP